MCRARLRKLTYDIWGDAVNISARIEANGAPGRIVLSDTTHHLVKDRFACTHRGVVEGKNRGPLDS